MAKATQRDTKVTVEMTRAEREMLERLAFLEDRSMASCVRALVKDACARKGIAVESVVKSGKAA